ncbi:phospholipase-like protein, partial [Tanacetum coccineum]
MDNVIEVFDAKARILLDNWFSVYENSKGRYFFRFKNSPFIDRVFPEKIGQPLKRVRVIDLLVVTRSAHLWSALSDEDAVKVCLLLVVNIVFMDREPKNYIADNLLELVDDLPTWDAYPWGEYIWKAFYRRTVNVISRHRVAVMMKNQKNVSIRKKKKKSPTSKKNETYNVYGFVWALK